MRLPFPPLFFLGLLYLSLLSPGQADPLAEDLVQKNLARIPASDPSTPDAPRLVPAILGIHPRLLFTADEVARIKAGIASDPLFKKAYDDTANSMSRFKLNPPQIKAIVTDDTASLSTSMARYASLACLYAVDPQPTTKQAIVDILTAMLNEPHWANTVELDCNMGAANNMAMVALLFDAVCNDLEPEFRAKMAQKLFTHARRLYYLGHKELCLNVVKYWQQDPQPNHRWYRDMGLAATLLAIADEPGIDASYLLKQLKAETDFVIKWFPPDGDCHEGASYQSFGFMQLALVAMMMDRNLGTSYLKAPGFPNCFAQQLYYWAPGRRGDISFGDDMNGENTFTHLDAAFFLGPRLTRDKDARAALLNRFQKLAVPNKWGPYTYPWTFLVFDDPSVGSGDYKALPTFRLFRDLGAASFRDSWEDNAVCFTFKCGPYGGKDLNEYRDQVRDSKGALHYVNVAHDDPDANTFALGTSGDFFFHPGLYSLHKVTSTANGVLVDDKGQVGEDTEWMQPLPDTDMRTLSYLTGWKTGPAGRIAIEGETAKAYKSLTQFRRTALWMPGDYILLLDRIAAEGNPKISWNGTVEKGFFDDPKKGRCRITTKKGNVLPFQILADKEFTGSLDYIYLTGRWGNQMAQQFRFYLNAPAVRFACLMDPWKKDVSMALSTQGETITLTVTSPSFTDVWTWQPPADASTPSVIRGVRNGQELLSLTAADKSL